VSAAREEVLARIGRALADVPAAKERAAEAPPRYRVESELAHAELVELFAERAGEYRARIRRAPDGEAALAAAIGEALADHGARRVAIPADLPEAWRPTDVELVPDDGQLSPADLDGVDGVLTASALAIAETGTFVLDGGPGQGRRALTLVPDLHVCVVEARHIVGTVPEAIRALESGAREHRRPVTFVSGPSATSDIELDRVEGVHGPRRLEVVIAH
jgi:L-lactate dehydrogenase complex protein LldG